MYAYTYNIERKSSFIHQKGNHVLLIHLSGVKSLNCSKMKRAFSRKHDKNSSKIDTI